MLIGYMRVSTIDQNVDLQRDALQAVGCERVYEDSCSGATVNPKFQGVSKAISTVGSDLCRFRFPVSGYILINRSASACSASASVT